MQKILALAFLLLLAPVDARHVEDASEAFGLPGTPVFTQIDAPGTLPGVNGAGEPTLGIPWNTDSVFYQAFTNTYRITFDGDNATWTDVTPPNSIINVDPMLHADEDLGRVWAGGLAGPCSIMAFSDDDGETWIPTGNMCSGAQFDHQSIGSGPHALLPVGAPTFEHATYYCAQLGLTACATSFDGGLTWGPFTEVLGACGGLHGHIRVSRVTGTAVVPDQSCGGALGFGFSDTNGVLWNSRTVAGSVSNSGGFDPSLQFGRDEGWLWYGHADERGAHIGLSKDEGLTWEPLMDHEGNTTTWLDVGQFHDPPIVMGTFSDVQVGDDDRVAFAFMGVEDKDGDGTAGEFPDPNQCNDRQEELVWHYYIAVSYDAGGNWTVTRMTEKPMQVGGVWDGGGSNPCRNLLDFNDMDIDSTGRIYVGFADGCTLDCDDDPTPGANGYRTDYAAILRQTTGLGLFAEFDGTVNNTGNTTNPGTNESNDSPGVGFIALVGVFAAVAYLARRK